MARGIPKNYHHPTMYYNGNTKDKTKTMRLGVNKKYLSLETRARKSSNVDRVTFVDWRWVRYIQFKKNRLNIVLRNGNDPRIKAYFDTKLLKLLRKSCKKTGYIKRSWLLPRNYLPINNSNLKNEYSSLSNDNSINDCLPWLI